MILLVGMDAIRSSFHNFCWNYPHIFYLSFDTPPPYRPFSSPASLYFAFPKEIGTYLCLYMCIICLFIVMKNKIKKYIKRMGQNTGTSKTEKKVIIKQVPTPLVQANQNLNSGRRLENGLNSFPSLAVDGRDGPDSFGSSKGDRNAIKLFRRKMPSPYATIKYPWTMYTRKKKKSSNTKNPIHRGTI